MTNPEAVGPTLTPDEWQRLSFDRDTPERETVTAHETDGTSFDAAVYGQRAELDGNMLTISDTEWGPRAIPALIALANAALPDDDLRKITRERVAELRSALGCFQADRGRLPDDAATERFLDALESYLPPAA